jgi:hypothetical protein
MVAEILAPDPLLQILVGAEIETPVICENESETNPNMAVKAIRRILLLSVDFFICKSCIILKTKRFMLD